MDEDASTWVSESFSIGLSSGISIGCGILSARSSSGPLLIHSGFLFQIDLLPEIPELFNSLDRIQIHNKWCHIV